MRIQLTLSKASGSNVRYNNILILRCICHRGLKLDCEIIPNPLPFLLPAT